uniref:Uncharacterized protein n=1 Tax=Zooxanthella nutricula TaxID=1333877 RepID=A0A7S2JFB0_9DINO
MVAAVPHAFASICRIICKFERACTRHQDVATAAEAANWLTSCLVADGYGAHGREAALDDAASVGEVDMLQALEWQRAPPAAETWLAAFCARIDCTTRGLFTPQLDWIAEGGGPVGQVALQRSSVYELPPRRLALGLLAHGLVATGMLPIGEARAAELIDAEGWEQLFGRNLWGPARACMVPQSYRPCLAKLLELSTRAEMQDMRRAAYDVAVACLSQPWEEKFPASLAGA